MKKIVSIIGARPQIIKCAALSLHLRKYFEEIIIHTGQHYDHQMSDAFFEELNIPKADYNLNIGSGSTLWQISEILKKLEALFIEIKPDLVIVFGDTNSTAAGAIAANKCNIKIAHVEAGLREFDKFIPEEGNKLITDILSDYYFSPTETGVKNLQNMGIKDNVFFVGDVSIDLIAQSIKPIENNFGILDTFKVLPQQYVFFTCHRAANTDNYENLKQILEGICHLPVPVIFPVHPRTRKAIAQFQLESLLTDNMIISEPLGFLDTQTLIRKAKCCITDSGGVIKESYFHKVQGLIIDTQTEWVETVNEGWNIIVGPNRDKIDAAFFNLTTPAIHHNSIGDGKTGEKIAQILTHILH